MAETILQGFGNLVLGQLGSLAVEELKLALGLEEELERIKSNLSSIQAVLRDAEKQQTTSESIKNWLGKLHDVMYDIDDLLDDITTELRLRAKNKGQLRKQVRKFFSRTNNLLLRSQWAHQIKSLCKKLEQIAFEKQNFVLSTESVDSEESSLRETHSKLDKSDLILGREDEKEEVIRSILSCGDCDSLSVIPVVGFGGVGKTTLAQLVYNDTRIDDSFDRKLWVYVSERFRIKKVLKQVISMATGENILQLTFEQLSLENLRIKMSDALKDKKYLLVLDDLWNEDSNEWRSDVTPPSPAEGQLTRTKEDTQLKSVARATEMPRATEKPRATVMPRANERPPVKPPQPRAKPKPHWKSSTRAKDKIQGNHGARAKEKLQGKHGARATGKPWWKHAPRATRKSHFKRSTRAKEKRQLKRASRAKKKPCLARAGESQAACSHLARAFSGNSKGPISLKD